ncbi:MAG: hypothetical protein WCO55_04405 [Candidatus Falkowbacteria bacterium]
MNLVKYFEELDSSLKALNPTEVIAAINKLFDGIYNCQLAQARELLSLYSTCDYLSDAGFDNASVQKAIHAHIFAQYVKESFVDRDKLSWTEIWKTLVILTEKKKK